MFRGEARGVTLRACGRCGGVWLDAVAAARVLAALVDAPLADAPRGGGLACVECGRVMEVRTPGGAGVEIDRCPDHGVWFDRRELELLVELAASRRGITTTQAPDPDVSARVGPQAVAGLAAAGAVTAVLTADAVVSHSPGAPIETTPVADVLIVDPALAIEGAELAIEGGALAVEGAGVAVEGAGELLSGAGEVAGAVVENAGELASAAAEGAGGILELFGAALEILQGLF